MTESAWCAPPATAAHDKRRLIGKPTPACRHSCRVASKDVGAEAIWSRIAYAPEQSKDLSSTRWTAEVTPPSSASAETTRPSFKPFMRSAFMAQDCYSYREPQSTAPDLLISAAALRWQEMVGGFGDGGESGFGVAGDGTDGAVVGFGHDHGRIDAGLTDMGCGTVT